MHYPPSTPLLLLATLAACGSTSTEVMGVPGRDSDQELLVSTGTGETPFELLFSLRRGREVIAIARLHGVDLVLQRGGERTELRLPFLHKENRRDSLLLRCAPIHGHEIELSVTPQNDGEVLVELRDRVGLRSSLLELSLAYEFVVAGTIDESSTPHLHPGADELAGDLAFQAPIAFLRSGRYSLALSPDVLGLREQRRLPQGLDLDRSPARIRHGLIAQTVLTPQGSLGPRTFTRRGATPVQVRAETLGFAHYLRISGDAQDRNSLAEAQTLLWERSMVPNLALPDRPLKELAWRQLCTETLQATVSAHWHSIDMGEIVAGTLSEMVTEVEARFDARHQQLRTAFAMGSMAARESRQDMEAGARSILDLVLSAPRRAGLIPARFSLTAEGSRFSWQIGADEISTRIGHHALDSAVSGFWLLQLSDYLADRREPVMAASRQLAYFFLLNQHSDGAIPVWYGREFLEPLAEPKWAADTAGPAMFLAEYARRSGDPRILEAARLAMDYLGSGALRPGIWPRPIRAPEAQPQAADPRSGNHPRHPFLLAMAARASMIVAETSGELSSERLADRFLEALSFHQQIWSPGWLPSHQRGGISESNREVLWGSPVQSLAAEVFLRGYRLTGRREWLQRGAAALRAGISADAGGWTPEGSLPAGLHWGQSTAIAVIEMVRSFLGQGVVDVAGGFAQGLDSLWFESLSIQDDRISFRLLSHAPFTRPARIVFRNIPTGRSRFQLAINGDLQGEFTRDQLLSGLPLQPRMVVDIEFRPPTQISASNNWIPRARISGPLGESATVRVEIATDRGVLQSISLSPAEGGLLVGDDAFEASELDQLDGLRVRLIHTDGDRRSTVPASGFSRIKVAAMSCLDLGDDADFALVGDQGSKITRFADGRENGRSIQGDQNFTYAVPVGSHSAVVDLQIHLTGSVRIRSDDLLLHEDEEPAPGIHDLKMKLSDPRLWRDGHLLLNFSVASKIGGEVNLAHILYRSEGETATVSDLGRGESMRSPDSRLRILVLPLSLADAPMRASQQSIDQAFFAGPQYRLTPEPEARMTAGSVSSLLSRMSGGLSQLRGETLPILRSKLSASELAADRDRAAERLAAVAWRRVAAQANDDLDAIVVVHSGELPAQCLWISDTGRTGGLPCVLLPERSADGSLISGGQALLHLLDSLYQLHDLASPEFGNFGQMALAADGHGHIPSGLAGVNLVRTGWADQLTIRPQTGTGNSGSSRLLSLSTLQEGRILYRIPFDQLPDRGDLLLESRAMSHSEPGFPGSGCLLYWEFADRKPLVQARGASAFARYLRLSPVTSIPGTPFSPGTKEDLFVSAASLDGNSAPSLATLQGESLWAIFDLQSMEGGRTNLELAYLGQDLLTQGASRWYSMRFQRTQPLPLDGQNQGLGSVTKRDSGYILQMRPTRGAGIRGRFLIAPNDLPMRLFVRINKRGPGTGSFHLEIDGNQEVVAHVPAGPDRFLAQIDLAPHAVTSSLQIDALSSGGEWTAELDRLLLVPKTLATQQVRLPGRVHHGEVLMDGVHYAQTYSMTADSSGKDQVVVPVIVPAGMSALRFSIGYAKDAAPETRALLSAELRSEDATWNSALLEDFLLERESGRNPLHLGIIEISGPGREQVAFLTFNLRAAPGTTIHFTNLSIDRP